MFRDVLFLAMVVMAVAAWWWAWRSAVRVRRRSRDGRCLRSRCRYPIPEDAERCPECGTPVGRHQRPVPTAWRWLRALAVPVVMALVLTIAAPVIRWPTAAREGLMRATPTTILLALRKAGRTDPWIEERLEARVRGGMWRWQHRAVLEEHLWEGVWVPPSWPKGLPLIIYADLEMPWWGSMEEESVIVAIGVAGTPLDEHSAFYAGGEERRWLPMLPIGGRLSTASLGDGPVPIVVTVKRRIGDDTWSEFSVEAERPITWVDSPDALLPPVTGSGAPETDEPLTLDFQGSTRMFHLTFPAPIVETSALKTCFVSRVEIFRAGESEPIAVGGTDVLYAPVIKGGGQSESLREAALAGDSFEVRIVSDDAGALIRRWLPAWGQQTAVDARWVGEMHFPAGRVVVRGLDADEVPPAPPADTITPP